MQRNDHPPAIVTHLTDDVVENFRGGRLAARRSRWVAQEGR
jgi:hypothetical protein